MARPRRATGKLTAPPKNESGDSESGQPVAKHRRIFDHLFAGIQSGELRAGDRLPSEAELGRLFGVSRITVAKAVLDLQRMGLVSRRPGAGTHVLGQHQTAGRAFGLLIPELGLTEIFEPICHGMMRTSFARPEALLWSNASTTARDSAKEAEQLVQSYIQQKVAGVFFAPLELTPEKDAVNRRIARSLERAQTPFVLLDRCYMPYPERSAHDLVGIDNRRAGFIAAAHLLGLGVRNLAFIGEEHAANTVDARITGFDEALRQFGVAPDGNPVWRGSPQDEPFVRRLLDEQRPEGIVCANDLTAARLMQTLLGLGKRIPEDVRIVGMDDVKYASLLPVPLTTIHQDCAGIGTLAMATMLERLEHPELPVRDVLAPIRLVVRRSCGAYLA
jgi:DNA-binding LacI/PurR family transcriptional regulator